MTSDVFWNDHTPCQINVSRLTFTIFFMIFKLMFQCFKPLLRRQFIPYIGKFSFSKQNNVGFVNEHYEMPHIFLLTHWGRDKMAAISQTTLSNAFSWMKMYEFRLTFHWSLFLNNIPILVQIMAWRRSGDKPLSKPMEVRLPTHICVTRPQWVLCFFISS